MNYKDQNILIRQLKKGDENAYIFLVDEYNKRLFAYALTLTNCYDQSQDIVQNVFLKTWKNRYKFNVKTSVQNYLFKSVYYEFINQYKKNRTTILLGKKYFDYLIDITNQNDESGSEKKINKILEIIEDLPPKCKEVFLLSRKNGLTNIEISEYLKISIKTVEAQITKAFKIIRNEVIIKE